MNITNRLLEIDSTLELHNEGEWNQTISEYSAFNDAGIECEVGEFLYGMVQVLKPLRVLETGTHHGISALYMGMALKDNALGHLDTYEIAPEYYKVARLRMKLFELENNVSCHLKDIADITPSETYNMALFDTEPELRFNELVKFYPHISPGGYMFIHDLHRHMSQETLENPDHPDKPYWPFGPIPDKIKEWLRKGELRPFHFTTPRGLTGFYKTHPSDFDWWKGT